MGKYRILFIDDEPDLLRLIDRLLSKHKDKWELLYSNSAEEALLYLEEIHVHIIVSDVILPGVNGIDFFHKVKELYPSTSIILMTAMPKIDVAVGLMKEGLDDYLIKPFDYTRLVTMIEECIEGREQFLSKTVLLETSHINCKEYVTGYRILRTIGEGGMGVVYLAEKFDEVLNKQFAIKILRKTSRDGLEDKDDEDAKARFLREAKVIQMLDHPNIVKLVEFGISRIEELPYLVMEYFRGYSLERVIRKSDDLNLSLLHKFHIIKQVLSAINAIHEKVLCHRDIKPSNILVNGSLKVKLTDFGTVKVATSDLTSRSSIIGTPSYVSPEILLDASSIDNRSDLFSMGVVAYELIFNKRPFNGTNLIELSREICYKELTFPESNVPLEIKGFLARLMAKKKRDRYQSAAEALNVLDALFDFKKMKSFEYSFN